VGLVGATLATLLPAALGQRTAQAASRAFVHPDELHALAYPVTCTTVELERTKELFSDDHRLNEQDVRATIVDEIRMAAVTFCNGEKGRGGCKSIRCGPDRKCRVSQPKINAMITKHSVKFKTTISHINGRFGLEECPCACVDPA